MMILVDYEMRFKRYEKWWNFLCDIRNYLKNWELRRQKEYCSMDLLAQEKHYWQKLLQEKPILTLPLLVVLKLLENSMEKVKSDYERYSNKPRKILRV